MKLIVTIALLALCGIAGWSSYNAIQRWKQGEVREVPKAKVQRGDKCFDAYPEESLADWHRRHAAAA